MRFIQEMQRRFHWNKSNRIYYINRLNEKNNNNINTALVLPMY